MEVFLTDGPGIGGRIKTTPEDFIVEEQPQLPPPGDGKQVIARVTAARWETNDLVEHIASQLGVPAGYIGFAGMKDKQAITSQYMSFPVSLPRAMRLDIPRATVEVLYRSRKPVYRGQLAGNHFKVTIRDLSGSEEQAQDIHRQIHSTGGFPNFFGVQRFGILRPITHVVGRYIVAGDLERAVMTYAANPMPGEDDVCRRARQWLQETRDFAAALERYPARLNFERRMIAHLAEHSGDWTGALRQLPEGLLRLFVHAYQSWLFNRMLSERMRRGLPIDGAVSGDVVLPMDRGDMQQRTGIPVTGRNLDKINRQIARHRCLPSAVLVGTEASLATGEMGEIERMVLEQENLSGDEFTISGMPSLSSRGLRRAILAPLTGLRMAVENDLARLSFSLPKGCYATCLLREFMKAPIQRY
ncbi:MAG: tRNA pseudouridine(13) synthase TruD [Candidatus Thermoplasmatota archaeon]|nr:tRNA pseudouridine(13) synthase TruD [Candidatus Thermoplasmatota archaeon]